MTTNDITKDKLISKPANDKFLENWERIFGEKYDPKNVPASLKPQAS